MSESAARRAPLLAGVAIGLALGLIYTRIINPVTPTNIYPALLRSEYRRDWVRLALLSHVADDDSARSRARLAGLGSEDIDTVIRELIADYATSPERSEATSSLLVLAELIDVPVPLTASPPLTPTDGLPASPAQSASPTQTLAPSQTAPPVTQRASATPSPSHTRSPTATPDDQTPMPAIASSPGPTALAAPSALTFGVAEQEHICRSDQDSQIEVIIRDLDGEGIAGVRVWLLWPDGADWAVTGLKPTEGTGYADFGAKHGVTYTLGLGEIGMPLLNDLRLKACPAAAGGDPVYGSWRIIIEPRPADPTASPTPRR